MFHPCWTKTRLLNCTLFHSEPHWIALAQEIEKITVPVRNPKDKSSFLLETLPIIFPHRLIAYLWDDVGITLSQSDIDGFWAHARSVQDPRLKGFESDNCTFRVPLGFYGDEAQLFTQIRKEKWLGLFCDILHFRPRSIRASKFLLFSINCSKLLDKGRTLNSILRTLVWSFNSLHEGVNPSVGAGGRQLLPHQQAIAGLPICRKYPNLCFSVVEVRGDWLFHRQLWRFKASWTAKQVCFKCPAESHGPLANRYYNVSEDAFWVSHQYTLEEFLEQQLPPRRYCHWVPKKELSLFDPSPWSPTCWQLNDSPSDFKSTKNRNHYSSLYKITLLFGLLAQAHWFY